MFVTRAFFLWGGLLGRFDDLAGRCCSGVLVGGGSTAAAMLRVLVGGRDTPVQSGTFFGFIPPGVEWDMGFFLTREVLFRASARKTIWYFGGRFFGVFVIFGFFFVLFVLFLFFAR